MTAQTIRGRVIVEGSVGQPVGGALVALSASGDAAVDPSAPAVAIDSDAVDAAFTNASGLFVLGATAPGTYVVRIDRIGFESWTSARIDLAAAETRSVVFELPIRPVRLAELDIRVRRQCVDDPRDAPQVEIVWTEARKALEAAQLAQRERLFRFSSIVFDRRLSERRLSILSVQTTAVDSVLETPFLSLPADDLSADGYIQNEGEAIYFYAPDAAVLLSDTFLSEHCFGLEREEEDGRTLVGLTFDPREDRLLPDISGVMWLDQRSAELQRVRFEYENIPYRDIDDDRIEGEIEFVQLPSGAFVVRDWFIRMPVIGRTRTVRRGGRDQLYLQAFTEHGGQLRDVFDSGGARVEWRDGIAIRGRIVNTLTGGPLADATLTLDRPRGADLFGHTGPGGTFVFDRLQPGKHKLDFDHPLLTLLEWNPREREIQLAAGETADVILTLPEPAELLAEECGRRAEGGVILGRVRQIPSEFPVARARVWAEWSAPDASGAPSQAGASGRAETASSKQVQTNFAGRYRICGVPLGVDVTVFLDGPDDLGGGRRLRLDRLVSVVNFEVQRR